MPTEHPFQAHPDDDEPSPEPFVRSEPGPPREQPDAAPAGPAPDEPAAGQLRGRHVGWARILEPEPEKPEPATIPLRVHTPPPAPPPRTAPPPAAPPARPAPEPHAVRTTARTDEDTDVPSALGRLIALIVTLGLGWALAVAVGVWLLVYLVSRAAG